jgi:hypothetical protein
MLSRAVRSALRPEFRNQGTVSLKPGLLLLGLSTVIEVGGLIALLPMSWELLPRNRSALTLIGIGLLTLTGPLPAAMAVLGRRLRFIHLVGVSILILIGAGWLFLVLFNLQDLSWFMLIFVILGFAKLGSGVCLYEPNPED